MAKGYDPYAPVSRIPRLLPPTKRSKKHKRSSSAPTRFEILAKDFKEWIQEKQQEKLIAIRHRHQSYSGRTRNRLAPTKVVPASNVSVYGYAGPQRQTKMKPPLPLHGKRSSGHDKNHPLPPVDRPAAYNSPAVRARSPSPSPKPVPPFLKRPKMIRPSRRTNGSEIESGTDSDVNGNYKPPGQLTPLEKARLHKIRQREKLRLNMESSDDEGNRGIRRNPAIHRMDNQSKTPKRKTRTLSDYQSDENSHTELGGTYNVANGFNSASSSPHIYSAINQPKITQNSSREALIRAQKLQMLNKQRSHTGTQESSSDEDPGGSYDVDISTSIDDEVWQKKRELEGLIARQEAELEAMQRQNASEREKEKKQAEQERKRRAAQRERLRVLQEAEEQDRLKRAENNRGSHTPHRPPGDSRSSSRSTSRRTVRTRRDPTPEATPVPKQPPRRRKTSLSALKSPTLPPKQQIRPRTPEVNDNTAFYLQVAEAEDANAAIRLVGCSLCGRKFAEDRLAKHTKVCKTNSKKKPRKVFDPIKMRIEGTEQAKYVDPKALAQRKPPSKPARKKQKWRTQHDDFIKTIRYAKKMSEMEANGGDVAALAPPPPTLNPDYVPCPHCNRRFNVTAAERHIPLCQKIKTKPPPANTRPRRR